MKYAMLIADGMSDRPVEELQGRTPLDVARTPHMDEVARRGIVGLVKTIPTGLLPSSDVAILALVGYDPRTHFTGRGPLEAASLVKLDLRTDQVAFRCNLVTIENEILVDYSAGHISSDEAKILIEALNKRLGRPGIRFYAGVSYRHLLVCDTGEDDIPEAEALIKTRCHPPHDVCGHPLAKNLPEGPAAKFLRQMMEESIAVLDSHEINQVRCDLGDNPGNMIWLWGGGRAPSLPSFKHEFGVEGAVISAVDVVKGIAHYAGLQSVDVPGATGYYDTDYDAKVRYALETLKKRDLVVLHVEATDEAGHSGDPRMKIRVIEDFDQKVVGPMLEALSRDRDYRLIILPDHATPVSLKTHSTEPVPFAACGKGIPQDEHLSFSEAVAQRSHRRLASGDQVMRFLLDREEKG